MSSVSEYADIHSQSSFVCCVTWRHRGVLTSKTASYADHQCKLSDRCRVSLMAAGRR